MKLLLRANAHRPVDGVVEIASSPDTPRREPWQWSLRTASPVGVDGNSHTISATLDPSGDPGERLALSIDPDRVSGEMSPVDLSSPTVVRRSADELIMLVVGRGTALLDRAFLLTPLDTMVLAGDDPLEISVSQASAEPASLVMVRLRSVDSDEVSWVP